uniref:Uncharacterized protein n=1 Tax=Mesocestoides corti TaxID=53468 RepID=A0A5K3FG21_MESCO
MRTLRSRHRCSNTVAPTSPARNRLPTRHPAWYLSFSTKSSSSCQLSRLQTPQNFVSRFCTDSCERS